MGESRQLKPPFVATERVDMNCGCVAVAQQTLGTYWNERKTGPVLGPRRVLAWGQHETQALTPFPGAESRRGHNLPSCEGDIVFAKGYIMV